MRGQKWQIALLGLLGLLSWEASSSHTAIAQCIQADISVQYNISGSQKPTERTNDVDFESHDACNGNVSVTTGVQGNVGGNGRVRQNRVVRHQFKDDAANNKNSLESSTVQIQSNPAIDVYNAADRLKY